MVCRRGPRAATANAHARSCRRGAAQLTPFFANGQLLCYALPPHICNPLRGRCDVVEQVRSPKCSTCPCTCVHSVTAYSVLCVYYTVHAAKIVDSLHLAPRTTATGTRGRRTATAPERRYATHALLLLRRAVTPQRCQYGNPSSARPPPRLSTASLSHPHTRRCMPLTRYAPLSRQSNLSRNPSYCGATAPPRGRVLNSFADRHWPAG